MVWLFLRENAAGLLFMVEKKLHCHVSSFCLWCIFSGLFVGLFFNVIENSSGMLKRLLTRGEMKWWPMSLSASRAVPRESWTPRWEEPPPTTMRQCGVGLPLVGASLIWGFRNQRVVHAFLIMTRFLMIVKWELCRAASKGQILNERKWVQSMWLNSGRLKVLILPSHYAKQE